MEFNHVKYPKTASNRELIRAIVKDTKIVAEMINQS